MNTLKAIESTGRVPAFFTLRWLPLLVGASVAVATLFLWHALSTQGRLQIERTIVAAVASVKSEIVARMDARILALVRLARGLERSADPFQEEWQLEARLNYSQFPGYQSIAWVDPSFSIRWIVRAEDNRSAFESIEEQHWEAMKAAQLQNAITFTRAMNLAAGQKEFAVAIPLFQDEEFRGTLNAVFRFQVLFDSILRNTALEYGIAILDGEEEIYRRDPSGGQYKTDWSQETTIDPYGITWRVQLWPQPSLLAEGQSALPTIALGTGMVLALLLAVMTALAQTARLRAQEAEMAHHRLSQEMVERQRIEEALREGERLAALGTSAAKLAHEISNPLNGISTTVQILERQFLKQTTREDETLVAAMQDIKNEINRLRSLLQEFRSLARPQQLALQPTDLVVVVKESLATEALHYSEQGITVEQESPTELPLVMADSEKLKQVLLNLYKNAAEAMPEGGTLKVRGYATEEQVFLEVSDTGIGIPEGIDIFKLFTTTKFEGTGLGLAIVQQIMTAHQGTISYASTPGQRTTFTLAFPVSPAATR
jgi:signal transduction histidine kinase